MRSVPLRFTVDLSVCRSARRNVTTPLSSAKSVDPATGIGYFAFENAVVFTSAAVPAPAPSRILSLFQWYDSVPVAAPSRPVSFTPQFANRRSTLRPLNRASTDIGYGSAYFGRT